MSSLLALLMPADLWTSTANLQEYVEFLQVLYSRVEGPMSAFMKARWSAAEGDGGEGGGLVEGEVLGVPSEPTLPTPSVAPLVPPPVTQVRPVGGPRPVKGLPPHTCVDEPPKESRTTAGPSNAARDEAPTHSFTDPSRCLACRIIRKWEISRQGSLEVLAHRGVMPW